MAPRDTAQLHALPVLSAENPPGSRRLAAVVVILLGLYALFLTRNEGACAGGADSSGYLNKAKLFEQGAVRTPERVIAGVNDAQLHLITFLPLGFVPLDKKNMAPSYPSGLPLALLLVSRFTGWDAAPTATMVLFALLGVVFTAWLGREFGLPPAWAWFAGALLAIAPIYMNMSLLLMSDVPATIFCAAAIVFAWKSRSHPAWAVAAGFMFAASVLARPADIIMLVPAAVCFGLNWRRWVFFGLGGLPGAVFFFAHNFLAFGHPFETGYGNATGNGKINSMFSLQSIPYALAHYARLLPFALTPVGLLGFGLPFLHRRDPVRVNVLLAWIITVLGFYATYAGASHNIYLLRFQLPAFPAIMVGSMLVLREIIHTKTVVDFFERVSKFLSRQAVGLVIWVPAVASSALTFVRYRHEHDFLVRYVLPALPIVVVFWLAGKVRRENNRGRALLNVAIPQLVMVLALLNFSRTTRLDMWGECVQEYVYPKACAWAVEKLPANSVIYTMQTSGALFYYTPFEMVRWTVLTPPARAEIERACAATNRPIYAMLFQSEVANMGETHFLDGWTQIASMPPITLWRFDAPGKTASAP